ncbi:hypothetical protein BD324DRAFT_650842 [Kockovaella imperatae]|uniref:Replication protein A C-terminal domain-containing protein n=1 Tax=Kockovaella imperatae TaxID=4999 RepID=A0A1Y1UIB9_9TREE|nr:hypothetical protein BD324DRAFT_650842 [Kockovaella imperatae]ORX37236.1 hypothetical protein BD324DRAFT_650842 [Kockovaella imperatae]
MSNYGAENPYYGGGGGGFVSGGSPYGSQGSQDGAKKNRSNQTLRPVTIKQILEADQAHPSADFTIDGQEVGSILVVGSVRNSNNSATKVSYEVGDGTGYIDVNQWLDTADDEGGKMDGISQDKYVSILGSIKVFGGKRQISATHIRPITNHDEVFNHLLKAVYVSMTVRYPNGVPNDGGARGAGGAVANDYSAGTTNGADSSAWAGLPPLQRKIMEIVAADDTDEGIHVATVTRQMGNVNVDEVTNAIEKLMDDGQLYPTHDEFHVKAVY